MELVEPGQRGKDIFDSVLNDLTGHELVPINTHDQNTCRTDVKETFS